MNWAAAEEALRMSLLGVAIAVVLAAAVIGWTGLCFRWSDGRAWGFVLAVMPVLIAGVVAPALIAGLRS